MVHSSKNILLAYPEFPKTTYWSFSGTRFFDGRKAVMPPLALLTVAAMLPEQYTLKLVDMNIRDATEDDLEWSDAVFTSSMIVQKDSLQELTERAHAHAKPVVAGGQLPTLAYEQIPWVDHFVLNEAESTLDAFIHDFESGSPKRVYAREALDFKENEADYQKAEIDRLFAFFNGSSQDIQVLKNRPPAKSTPVPRFDLLEDIMHDYVSMAVQVSKGCPFKCSFCEIPRLYGHVSRAKEGIQIINEFELLYDMGWKGSVFVVDDNFIGNRKAIEALLPEIAAWQERKGFPYQLFTEASIDIDEKLLALMRSAGFNRIFTGIETFEKKALKNIHKGQNAARDIPAKVRQIQKYGIEVFGGFIVGLDGATDESYEAMISGIQDLGIVNAMVGLLTISPGSPDYYAYKQQGRLLEESGGDNTHTFDLNFIPEDGQNPQDIIDRYKYVLNTIYDPSLKNYFQRVRTLYDTLGDTVRFAPNPSWKSAMAGMKSILYQPFQPYGPEYLKFGLWALTHHPTKIVDAITDAIKGHHFWEITQGSLELHNLTTSMQEKIDYFKTTIQHIAPAFREQSEHLASHLSAYKQEAQESLNHLGKRIKKLPPLYREAAQKHYALFSERLQELFTPLEKALHTPTL